LTRSIEFDISTVIERITFGGLDGRDKKMGRSSMTAPKAKKKLGSLPIILIYIFFKKTSRFFKVCGDPAVPPQKTGL